MQFKVPQNIDLEDKIVGPMTLVQFLYVLSGSLIIYALFQVLYSVNLTVFIILAIPIALATVGLAFVKIQDQPLPYFAKAGVFYLLSARIRIWQRSTVENKVLAVAPTAKKEEVVFVPKKGIEKSQLEQLAQALDTKPLAGHEVQNFGSVATAFEKLLGQNVGARK